jgi:hypothetical protein
MSGDTTATWSNFPSGFEEIAAVLQGCTTDLPTYLPTALKHDWRCAPAMLLGNSL